MPKIQQNYMGVLVLVFFLGALGDIALSDMGFSGIWAQIALFAVVAVFLVPLLSARSARVGLDWKWGFTGLIPVVGFIFGAFLFFFPLVDERTPHLPPPDV
ncbi:MAG: hypothetical protein JWO81_2621 [Alphaproteobacteria bacterium]|nr:hypothetical protein [Alphaproteobacteria bacterium]